MENERLLLYVSATGTQIEGHKIKCGLKSEVVFVLSPVPPLWN